MGDFGATKLLFDEFQVAVKKNDIQGAKTRLSKLKLNLTHLKSLTPFCHQTSNSEQELLLAREILEHAVFFSIQNQDDAGFERNYLQLGTYYTDARHLVQASKYEQLIVGLNLLRLLVQNRIAEFHTELELLIPEVQQSEYVKLVTQLEQWLMEGAYNKVLDARKTVPDQSYSYFMEKLLTTVRDEIAGCSEAAYSSLSIPEAKRLMLFNSDSELAAYCEERSWQVKGGKVVFSSLEGEDSSEVTAVRVINNTLTYARELERIV